MTGSVIFILGGPGVGKGTQCTALANASTDDSNNKLTYVHLSAGDLLRAERSRPNSQYAPIINHNIQQGTIVPSQITIDLLKAAMQEYADKCDYFLIDGFPRNVAQGIAFESQVSPCAALLFFDCPEEILVNRVLKRSQTSGRDDDNLDSIRKRLVTYRNETLPVIDHYERQGKVFKIDCNDSVAAITEKSPARIHLDASTHPAAMSSFLKKNPRLSGIIKSDENIQSVSLKTGTPGLTPSLTGASSLLASTGIPDLDICLGGGLPPASLFTVFEDFPASKANFTWTGIVRCFLAEGVATAATDWSRKDGGWLAIVGHDISGILATLPKPETTNSTASNPTAEDGMKIAWRYEGLKEFDSTLKRPISALASSAEKTLGHTFDLGRKHDAIPKQLQETSRALQLDLKDTEPGICDYQRAWGFIKESIQINQRSGLGRIVVGSLGVPGIWTCSCSSAACGPAWLVKSISHYIQEFESSHPCLVLVTVPTTYLVDNLVIPGIQTTTTKAASTSKLLPTWVSAIENVSDAVIELKPLAGLTFKSQSSLAKSLLTREYDGFLLIRKALRRPNSFKPFIPETANLAFKIKRRRFGIEKFHLPPSIDDSGATETSLPCSKGTPSLSSKSSHPLDF